MSFRIGLIKRIDSVIGRLAVPLARMLEPKTCADVDITSILVIRPGGIGDAILLIPAIQSLKEMYPTARIVVLAEKRNAAAFSLCNAVNQVLLYDNLAELTEVIRGDFSLVIDSEQWHHLSAVIARFTRAPLLIGFGTNERARLFRHAVSYSQDEYEAESFLRLLQPVEVSRRVPQERFLNPPDVAVVRAAEVIAPLKESAFVVLFPGASIPQRKWGADRFGAVARELVRAGLGVVVVGGKQDYDEGASIIAEAGGGLNLAGRTLLAETAAIIDRSDLLISGDSGVLHIAVGLGKPTVSLFGPGRARKWAPRGEQHIVINKNLSCSPCTMFGTTPPCPRDAACMRKITVGEVLGAAMLLLKRGNSAAVFGKGML